jgi:hypothetical protein
VRFGGVAGIASGGGYIGGHQGPFRGC